MGKLARHVTIADVAALAGVSVGTASKALNGRGSLREETRVRVREAARQLNFEVNAGARSLHSGRTYTVGMITTDTIGRFSIPVLMGAEDALGAGQMSVFLCDGRDDPIREQYHVKTLIGRRVDGIIVTGRRTQARAPIAASLPVPVVYAFISSTDPDDCSVVPDEAGGARKAV
ncbi:LacI family DNA-binding transcriptional regulator, partial [Nonomuraea sp. KM90]